MSFFGGSDGGDVGRTEGIECIGCGTQFVQSRGFVGYYCEECRYDTDDIDRMDGTDMEETTEAEESAGSEATDDAA